MTVAAVILAASPEDALADADGQPAVRRIADVAWSGGAVPIVVVAPDPDGRVAAALAGAPVVLAEPPPGAAGSAGELARGVQVAAGEIRDTAGALAWPAEYPWVGPETVTSLIEAFGVSGRSAVLRPADDAQPGWPVLVPATLATGLAEAGGSLDDAVLGRASVPVEILELGDPGTVFDRGTRRADLPPYRGPSLPAGGHVHEWGAAIADEPDDAPLAGPALAPYGQAVAEDPDRPG